MSNLFARQIKVRKEFKVMDWFIKRFEELEPYELYDILKKRNEVFVVEQKCIYQDCDDKDRHAYHMFIKENGEIIAYLRILKNGISYKEVSIGRVLVIRKYRGQGIGRDMMLKALMFIEDTLNEREIRISAQFYLVRFYESLRFMRVSKMYLEDEIPHIEMLYKGV
jgi:ElaA protein